MKKNTGTKGNRQEDFAADIAQAEAELGEMNLMKLLSWGSSALLQKAVETEITRYLGRGYYEHLKPGEEFKGERHGYRTTTIDTPIGQVIYERQRVNGAPDFKSKYHVAHMRRPKEFAQAVAEMYVNGVSTGKVKRALKAVTGEKAKLSKSTVSRITKGLREEFKTWIKRDLSGLKVAYLFLDAIRIGMRLDSKKKQAVLIAYAVLEDGSFETLSIGLGNSESDKSWGLFVGDLKNRGLKDPLLTVSDGNPAVIHAIDTLLPTGYRQRCVKHRMENILAAIPEEKHREVRLKLNRVFYGATSLEQAKEALKAFKREYGKVYTTAISRLETDLDQALTFYLFPSSHWRRIRTSNRLERMNLEIRRRLNVIGRHPSEEGCLSLVFQICKRYADARRNFRVDDLAKGIWKRLREEKINMITQLELDLVAA